MNFKAISLVAAVAVSAAVAQDYEDDVEETSAAEESVEEAAPAPAPAAPAAEEEEEEEAPAASTAAADEPEAAAPVAAEGLNVLHGNAYNAYGNEAGASTIGGDFNAPYKMAGRNLLYVQPSDEFGAVAFTSGASTFLLGFNNDMGVFTAGYATKAFGVALDLTLDKRWDSKETSTQDGKETDDYSTTFAGDVINVKFAAPLGTFDIAANVYWLTWQTETDETNEATGVPETSNDNDYWQIGAGVTISNGPSAKNLFWSAGADFYRHGSYTEATSVENIDGKPVSVTAEITHSDAYIYIAPRFNFALPVIAKSDARVALGLNTSVPVVMFDELKNADNTRTNSASAFGLNTVPNVLGEMALTENWVVFGGAAFKWELLARGSDTLEEVFGEGKNAVTTTTESSYMKMKTNTAMANAGARFQYKNLVLEANIADELGSASWSGLVANFGAFLIF